MDQFTTTRFILFEYFKIMCARTLPRVFLRLPSLLNVYIQIVSLVLCCWSYYEQFEITFSHYWSTFISKTFGKPEKQQKILFFFYSTPFPWINPLPRVGRVCRRGIHHLYIPFLLVSLSTCWHKMIQSDATSTSLCFLNGFLSSLSF